MDYYQEKYNVALESKNKNGRMKMKSVVLCGSRRFKPEIRQFGKKLKELGILVYEPFLHTGGDNWEHISNEHKEFILLGLTHDHFYKIRMADVVFVYNKDGYAGVSTTLEIGYAVGEGKPIYALSGDDELARYVLFRSIITTPEKLIEVL